MIYNAMLLASKLFPHASQTELDQHARTIRDFGLRNQTFPESIYDFMDKISVEFNNVLKRVDLYDFQKLILMCLESRNSINILISRQMGMSFILRAYALWIAESQPESNIVLSLSKLALNDLEIKIEGYIPSFSMVGKTRQTFSNGSTIWFTSHSNLESTARGITIDCLMLDGAQNISFADEPKIKNIMAQASQVITTGNAGSKRSMFYDMTIVNTTAQTMILPWYVIPERTSEWETEMIDLIGQEIFDQEFNLQFK